eukprot:2635207-Prymnesium_polylepis.1
MAGAGDGGADAHDASPDSGGRRHPALGGAAHAVARPRHRSHREPNPVPHTPPPKRRAHAHTRTHTHTLAAVHTRRKPRTC